jgi:hypothetical protein
MRFFLVLIPVLAICSIARAQLIYQTGFEGPAFVDGDLLGQDAWQSTDDPATSNRGVVQSSLARTGSRAVRLDASVTTSTDWYWRPMNFTAMPAASPIVQIEWAMNLGSAGTPSAGWGIDVYDDSLPIARRISAVIVDNAGILKVWNGTAFFNTSVVVSRNSWHVIKLNMNYTVGVRQVSLYLDGIRVANGLGFSSGTSDTIADVDLYNIDGGGGDAAYYDDLRIVALSDSDADGVPDPDDLCPVTAAAAPVDGNGCSTLDDDGDGVNNDIDLCANTPACANAVSPDGCPADSDSDTVVDGCDNCPNDQNPGQEDTDSDGQGDACDACPSSMLGDTSGNGQVNGRDVLRFTELVLGAVPVGDELCASDMNDDSLVDEADIPGFTDILLGL